jgi:predicted nuclease with RNAse H fold
MPRWLGVDVGGERKRFDVALIDDRQLLHLRGGLSCAEVVDVVDAWTPRAVAIDSPRCCAPDGQRSRVGERELARAVCGIRWTPERARVEVDPYYGWVREGLALFEALSRRPVDVIEVFPTASWARWLGKRGKETRSSWSRHGLTGLDLGNLPRRTNQDQRDAIAAAVTAREHSRGETTTFAEIVVPRSSPRQASTR